MLSPPSSEVSRGIFWHLPPRHGVVPLLQLMGWGGLGRSTTKGELLVYRRSCGRGGKRSSSSGWYGLGMDVKPNTFYSAFFLWSMVTGTSVGSSGRRRRAAVMAEGGRASAGISTSEGISWARSRSIAAQRVCCGRAEKLIGGMCLGVGAEQRRRLLTRLFGVDDSALWSQRGRGSIVASTEMGGQRLLMRSNQRRRRRAS